MSSYGDFIALSDTCDEATARLINREVSDGVIAHDYTPEALEILRQTQTKSSLALQLCKSVLPSIEKIILEFIPHCHKSGKILPLKFFLKFAQS